MVSAQITGRRVHCVHCKRKRMLKFMYRIRLPFCFVVIEVCVDCFEKYSDQIKVERPADAAVRRNKS